MPAHEEQRVTACPRCAAIHSGEDRFCPNCGLPMSRKSDLPIAGAAESVAPAGSPGVLAPAAPAPPAGPPPQSQPVAQPAPAPANGGEQPTEIIRPPSSGS